MARGKSGRLVIEIDPEMKRELHARVAREGRTLKDWLVEQAKAYLAQGARREAVNLSVGGGAR